MSEVIERFLNYAKVYTTSDGESETSPSTMRQKDLGKLLVEELKAMGAAEPQMDEFGYVYAYVPATMPEDDGPVVGFIAHMDTSPEASGENVNPQFVYDYDGGDIMLGGQRDASAEDDSEKGDKTEDDSEKDDKIAIKVSEDTERDEETNSVTGLVLSPSKFPELRKYIGQTLITTDGTTLLGADDKAGIAEIMTMAEELLSDIRSGEKKFVHGRIAVAFTPDEEIGEGTKHFDTKRFGADYAYTVDGGAIGELEFENFNAAAAVVKVKGLGVHPGEAKDKMLNASRVAAEFDTLLSADERPEYTEGYEGFFHLMKMNGNIEEAELQYIIRDHSKEKFEEKKQRVAGLAEKLSEKYSRFIDKAVTVEVRDQYFNMRSKIEPDNMFLIDNAVAAMKELGIEPVITPIRGGTDGANLSFMGIPCPNLCAGGHNFHGRYEYVCAESIVKISELLMCIVNTFNIVK